MSHESCFHTWTGVTNCSRDVVERRRVRTHMSTRSLERKLHRYFTQPANEIPRTSADETICERYLFFVCPFCRCVYCFSTLPAVVDTCRCMQYSYPNSKEPHLLFSRCFKGNEEISIASFLHHMLSPMCSPYPLLR